MLEYKKFLNITLIIFLKDYLVVNIHNIKYTNVFIFNKFLSSLILMYLLCLLTNIKFFK